MAATLLPASAPITIYLLCSRLLPPVESDLYYSIICHAVALHKQPFRFAQTRGDRSSPEGVMKLSTINIISPCGSRFFVHLKELCLSVTVRASKLRGRRKELLSIFQSFRPPINPITPIIPINPIKKAENFMLFIFYFEFLFVTLHQ